MTSKETVIIVHGTFAAPYEGPEDQPVAGRPKKWYEPGSDFCQRLDEMLAAKGSQARCWAHLEECGDEAKQRAARKTAYFCWSGQNAWIDRSAAAKAFLSELKFLIDEKGWTCHVVAHSHGGNVVLEALDLDNPFRQGGLSSNYVLLGTPFLQFAQRGRPHQTLFEKFREYTTPSTSYSGPRGTVAGRESSYARIGAGLIFSLVAWALLAHYVFGGANVAAGALLITSPIFWTGVIVVSLATATLYWRRRYRSAIAIDLEAGLPAVREFMMEYPPRLLFINSRRDEAFGFLRGVKNAPPWPGTAETPPGMDRRGRAARWLAALNNKRKAAMQWLQAIVSRAKEADRQRYPWQRQRLGLRTALNVAGVAALALAVAPLASWAPAAFVFILLAAVLLAALIRPAAVFLILATPWRLAEAAAYMAVSAAQKLISEYVRRRVWSTLQEIAFGISGSPHRLRDVMVFDCPDPQFARGEFLYQTLAKPAEDAAAKARSHAFYAELEKIEKESDSDFWRFDKWRNRIGSLAEDPALVHTVYYRHPDAIDQIASHLARSGKDLLAERRRAKAAASDSDVEWLSWSSSSADAFMEGLASRDPVAARALAGEMRRVAETRGDSLLWEYWARASFYLIEAFGQAQDPSEAQQGLVDLRRIAEARNEDIIWRWWAKASFSLIVDLGARRDGAAAQALLDAAKLLNVLTEFGDMSAKQSLVPTVVSGTEPPPPEQMAAAKIVWDALKPIEEARHECRDWEQWAKHALARDEEYKIAPRDLAAAQALLNDLHGVAGVAQRRRSFQPLRPSFLRFGGRPRFTARSGCGASHSGGLAAYGRSSRQTGIVDILGRNGAEFSERARHAQC